MLKRFEVENFKGFKDRIVFDLSARDYSFNQELVGGGLVKHALIYGKNGIGKSSLGLALFDIINHLTDKKPFDKSYYRTYHNLDRDDTAVRFKYTFNFGEEEVCYEYAKTAPDALICEKLTIGEKTVINWNFTDPFQCHIDKDFSGGIEVILPDNHLSVIKYLYRNLPTLRIPVITQLCTFCEKMLWYRCLSEGNTYAGFTNGNARIADILAINGNLKEFTSFLKRCGLDYALKLQSVNGRMELFATFNDGKNETLFEDVASTGTQALALFYLWSISAISTATFVFIDEFDAFLHYEAAEAIVKELNSTLNAQTVLTTHNTYLMQNDLTRPDCCFIMTDNRITPLCRATHKEIREAHNLEKMYVNGAFGS